MKHTYQFRLHTLGLFSICSDAYTSVFPACTKTTARMAMHLHNVDPLGMKTADRGQPWCYLALAACRQQQM